MVPREYEQWFFVNEMHRFSRGRFWTGINDVANGVTLRADVHACFDRDAFVFYPLVDDVEIQDTPSAVSPRYVAFVIDAQERCYIPLLHRREVYMHERVSEEFLLARFALAIISLNRDPIAFKNEAISLPPEFNASVHETEDSVDEGASCTARVWSCADTHSI